MKQLKLVHGVGINDADYPVTKNEVINGKSVQTWICPFYLTWKSMLTRCYSELWLTQHPSYVGCFVCPEWKTFSSFRGWMITQQWEGKQLDKDLLITGNKIYSSETCVFIEQRLNLFIIESKTSKGQHPPGVSWDKKASKYRAQGQSAFAGKRLLGFFSTPYEAHLAWIDFKLEQAYVLVEDLEDKRVANAIVQRYKNYPTSDEKLVDAG